MGADPWVVEVLRSGYHIPFSYPPPLSMVPLPIPSYSRPPSRGRLFVGRFCPCSTRGDRASSPLSGLLQPPVCCVENYGFVETCSRSFAPQPLCPVYAVPNGDCPVGPPCVTEE